MPFKNGKICLPATSETGARWPIFSLVVVATTSRRDNKDQMIRPLMSKKVTVQMLGKCQYRKTGPKGQCRLIL
jgi:hypothetical protein